MRMWRQVFSLLAIFLLWTRPGWALGVEAAVDLWGPTATGSVAYQALASNDRFDLEHEAGLSREANFGGRLKVDLPILPDLLFQATPLEFSGTGSKGGAFDFGGHSYAADAAVASKLVLDHYDLGLVFGVPLLKTASLKTLNVDFGLIVRRQEVRVELVQPDTGQFARVDKTYYLPLAYLAAQVRLLKKMSLEAELRGFVYSGNHYYDLVGRCHYDLPGPLFLAGGWRYQKIELSEDGIQAAVNFSGPFAEVGFGL
ncbi:MAG: TIGR04219 family outer membrane beta-barrel protein [Desulfobulbaceae bacterium]|nr:TIGR04219 family outer membrane beta-barrel protein [Desulfobulbaceae bacterium]